MSVLVLAEAPGALVKVCGITLLERLLRTLARAGVRQVTVLSSEPERLACVLGRPSWARASIAVTLRGRSAGVIGVKQVIDAWPEGTPGEDRRLLVISAGGLYDRRLIKTLIASASGPGAVLIDSRPPASLAPLFGSGRGEDLVALIDREWMRERTGSLSAELARGVSEGSLAVIDVESQPRYIPSMRRELRPLFLPAPADEAGRAIAERFVLDAAQKQSLDFPAYVHAPIETWLVSKLCRTRITPNQLSLFGNLVAWFGTWLFATGRIGWGTAVALAVGVLDGIDGKQARVKVEDTPGGKLEHWFDGLFEVSWAAALAYHFWRVGEIPGAFWLLGLLLAAEAVDGVAKGLIIWKLGRQIDDVDPFDRVVRLFGGRRNVYVWILAAGVLVGHAREAFIVIPWWEAATACVHLPRALWLVATRRRRTAFPTSGGG